MNTMKIEVTDAPDAPLEEAIDRMWQDIILANRPKYGDWEYGGQAYRHILVEHTMVLTALKGCLEAMYDWGRSEDGLTDKAHDAWMLANSALVDQWPSHLPRNTREVLST